MWIDRARSWTDSLGVQATPESSPSCSRHPGCATRRTMRSDGAWTTIARGDWSQSSRRSARCEANDMISMRSIDLDRPARVPLAHIVWLARSPRKPLAAGSPCQPNSPTRRRTVRATLATMTRLLTSVRVLSVLLPALGGAMILGVIAVLMTQDRAMAIGACVLAGLCAADDAADDLGRGLFESAIGETSRRQLVPPFDAGVRVRPVASPAELTDAAPPGVRLGVER